MIGLRCFDIENRERRSSLTRTQILCSQTCARPVCLFETIRDTPACKASTLQSVCIRENDVAQLCRLLLATRAVVFHGG